MFHFTVVYQEYDISSSSINITTDDGKELIDIVLTENKEYSIPKTTKIIAWFEINLFMLEIEEIELFSSKENLEFKKRMIMDEFNNVYDEIVCDIEDEKVLETLENVRKSIVYEDIISKQEERHIRYKLDMDKIKKRFVIPNNIIEKISNLIFYDYTMEGSYNSNYKKIMVGAVCTVEHIFHLIKLGSKRSDKGYVIDPLCYYRKTDDGTILTSNTDKLQSFDLGLKVYPTEKENYYIVSGAGTTI